jgi:SAM-dependent methyltransferase
MYFDRLAVRRRQPEIMDEPGLDAARHVAALRALARINALSAGTAVVWGHLLGVAKEVGDRPVRVLDVASGGGDALLRLWRRGRRAGVRLELCGVDVSPTALAHAGAGAQAAGADIAFRQLDVLRDELPGGHDVIVSSLFLHHLHEGDAVTLLAKMRAAAERLVLVDDLVRSRLGYVAACVGTRLLTRSGVVHVDGPRSVAGAFTACEAQALAERAGLHGASVRRHWPWRYLLAWRKPA